jgi:hypothetical protein
MVHKRWNHEFRIPGWLLVHGGAWSSPSSPLGVGAVMGMDEMPAAFWSSVRAPEVGIGSSPKALASKNLSF